MPLIQWILNNGNLQYIGEGGVTAGGEADTMLATNHSGSGGGLGGGTSLVGVTHDIQMSGGAIGSPDSIVQFIPNPNIPRRRIRLLPGDIVYDCFNTKYVVQETRSTAKKEIVLVQGTKGIFKFLSCELSTSPIKKNKETCLDVGIEGFLTPGVANKIKTSCRRKHGRL